MWTIFHHQLRDNVGSMRFQVSLVVLLLFFICNGLIYSMKMDRLMEENLVINSNQERERSDVDSVADAADHWYPILNPETGTEFIAEAGFNWFPSTFWVNPEYGNNGGFEVTRTTNNWMRRFEVLDWTLIVRYVLSFLCIVLAYNAISGELESGTLRLVLANPLARGAFLVGKFLAHLATLGVAVISGSLSSLAILVFGGLVQLDVPLWRGYLLFLLAALLFAALFLLLSMGVSILARNSASALVFLVTAWTVLIVVIPQASYLIATQVVPGTGRWWEGMNELRNDTRASLEREGTIPRDPSLARQDGYAVERRYVQRMQELDKELNQIMMDVEAQRSDQFRAAMKVNLLSPGFAFQYSVEAFLGAGLPHVENFGQQGMRYREQLRQFLRGRDADDPDSPHILFLQDFMSSRKLEAGHIPRFEPQPIRFADRAANAIVPLVVLVLEATLAFFFALWAINRAELAGS